MKNQELAEKIATEILTAWIGSNRYIECTRAQLMLRQPDGLERIMGGRNKDSLVKAIEEILNEERK